MSLSLSRKVAQGFGSRKFVVQAGLPGKFDLDQGRGVSSAAFSKTTKGDIR
jgi:hypothetical protein